MKHQILVPSKQSIIFYQIEDLGEVEIPQFVFLLQTLHSYSLFMTGCVQVGPQVPQPSKAA
jgi:hypothetical protein